MPFIQASDTVLKNIDSTNWILSRFNSFVEAESAPNGPFQLQR